MTDFWYVIRSKAHKESYLAKELEARNVTCFFPHVKVRPVNPRSKRIRPYFPNYLFVKANLEENGKSFLEWVPYSQGLVKFGGEPAIVPEPLVLGIQKSLNEINANGGLKAKKFSAGDGVRVIEGYFRGYEGIFDSYLDGNDRVKILLDLLTGRQLPLSLDERQITSLS